MKFLLKIIKLVFGAKPKPSFANDSVRVCPYCNDEFIAHHKLQRYCPKKFGKINYCKNRMKTINKKNHLANP